MPCDRLISMKPGCVRSWTTMERLPGMILSSSPRTANCSTSGTWWETAGCEVCQWWRPLQVSARWAPRSRPGGPRRWGGGEPAATLLESRDQLTLRVSCVAASHPETKVGLLQSSPCPHHGNLILVSPGERKTSDKVEIAFNKFDLDSDGYLSWEEFRQVSLSLRPDCWLLTNMNTTVQIGLETEVAARIFRFCDSVRSAGQSSNG